ncbi:hypothetical protein K7J14_15170 [Treponema zuelzerae]|uniref:Uncharacterized protein n=1 Tax=Teretinema zuelzerae TaxID=156 RepID=A0AAE3JMV3_9SPIR|nr:hypothetical protein [Teretinema zuelzerae]MCD1656039.1 hypothetical protein [Teretinema zuelzerae]
MSDVIIAFSSTLLGAFLGVYIPVIISKLVEKGNCKRYLNLLFIKACVYYNNVIKINNLINQGLIVTENTKNDYRETISNNIQNHFNISDIIPDLYWKYIKPEFQFSIIQNDINIKVMHTNLISTRYVRRDKFDIGINSLLEVSATRIWIIYQILNNSNKEFSQVEFNQLISRSSKDKFELLKKK